MSETFDLFDCDLDNDGWLLPIISGGLGWLDANCLDSEGIWTKVPAKSEISELHTLLNDNQIFPTSGTADSTVGLLMQFLRSGTSGGLLGAATCETLLKHAEKQAPLDVFRLLQEIKSFEKPNKCDMLALFVRHWQRVIANIKNQVDLTALATHVFSAVCPSNEHTTQLIPVLKSILQASAKVSDPSCEWVG